MRLKGALLILLTTLAAYTAVAAEDFAGYWKKANALYTQKQYDSAAIYYNKIAEGNPADAEVYYNLGNTYYRLNDIGNAVLNYERALKYNPSYKQAEDNLYLTQSRINNRILPLPEIFFVQWWHKITAGPLSNTYAVIALVLFLATIAYHILRRLNIIQLTFPVQVTVGLISLSAIFILLSIVAGGNLTDLKEAVVMADQSPIMAEPKSGKSISLIPEGTKVEISAEQATWVEVTLPDGRTGWMAKDALVKI